MYYLLLVAVCLLGGLRLVFNKMYVNKYGAGLKSVYWFTFLSCAVFSVLMLSIGTKIRITAFSLTLAIIFALINAVCTYFGFSVLRVGNVSKYTLFLYLGGMILPFLYGAFFNGDHMGIGRILCLLFVSAALVVNINRQGEETRKARLYYIFIFLLNGIASVLLSFHQNNNFGFENVSTSEFTVLYMMILSLLSLFMVILLHGIEGKRGEGKKVKHGADLALAVGFGITYGVGNLLTTLCMLHIEPSFQFPIITGGSIVISGLIGLFFEEKIGKKFVISATLVMIGTILILF